MLLFVAGDGCLLASPLKEAELLPAFSTRDQHEKAYSYAPGAQRLILVSFSMGAGKAANEWFAKKPADFLDVHKAIFLADIHGMPSFARGFALPKMRKYPHRILLGEDEKLLADYPRKEDCLTAITLDDKGLIVSIRFVDPTKGLDEVFNY